MSEDRRKARPRGEWAESTRRKQNEYKRTKRMKLAADVDRETGEKFRSICSAHGLSVSAMLSQMIREAIAREDQPLDL